LDVEPRHGYRHQREVAITLEGMAWTLSLRLFLRIQILLGWMLARLLLAGVTGIVRKD
jgi:hypothetical protein